jgi:hypothetical protein
MHLAARLAETIHVAALGLWAGSMACVGVTAAIAFPTLRDLGPYMPDFGDYPDEHWRIAAGHVMNRVFMAIDYAAMALAAVAILTLGLRLLAARVRQRPTLIRLGVTLLATAMLLVVFFTVRLPMTEDAHAYWEAARAGEVAIANTHKAAFDGMHQTASNLYVGQFAIVLLALVLAGFDLSSPSRHAEPRAVAS